MTIRSRFQLSKFVNAVVLTFGLCLTALADQKQRQPNHLLGVQSPYLQQHLYNAVDWYPWDGEALAKAEREQKPIFVSIGYSTCHWCHVMARESFDDEAIGKFLNEHFVSIKIDRERRPDLDEQFSLATQALTGQSGWPNSVFLTPGAKPFFASTYLPPDMFLNVLQQIQQLWEKERPVLEKDGDQIAAAILSYMNRTRAASNIDTQAINLAMAELMEQVDYFDGGLGTAPKFPQESALLFVLDRAKRGDQQALGVVIGALDGMIKGGIHDHVGGGFHRYAVDPGWIVPHFEKMLYNQALIGSLLVQTYQLTGLYRYKQAATRLFDYVIREMQSDNGGFYSAQDADSYSVSGEKSEGEFYLWSKAELEALGPIVDPIRRSYDISEDGNFHGKNILSLPARVDELAGEIGETEESYYRSLEAGLDVLLRRRMQDRKEPHKDRKILVSWNAMMISSLAVAAPILDRPDYWQAASKAAEHIIQTMLLPSGLKRVSFEQNVGVDAQLADYAGLGVALLDLNQFSPDDTALRRYEDIAKSLADALRKKFADRTDPEAKPLHMTEGVEGLGKFSPLDDNPIPSGNSLALQLFSRLGDQTGNLDYRKRAHLLAATLSGHAIESPEIRGTLINTIYNLTAKTADHSRYAANGNVLVRLKLDRKARRLNLDLRLKPGWHINSHQPLEDYFVPTTLTVGQNPIGNEHYPPPIEKKLKFNDKVLSLYERSMEIDHPIPAGAANQARQLSLQLQACSDEICLEPETLKFQYWVSDP